MSRSHVLIVGWVLALLTAGAFARLGAWQYGRAVEKQRMLDQVSAVLVRREPRPLSAASTRGDARRFDWAQGRGRFVPGSVLLLDNQQRGGRVGVRVYGVFLPHGASPLLVDLGWLAVAGNRRFPTAALPTGEVELRGLLAPPPSAGIRVGAPLARQGDAWLMLRVDPPAIARALALQLPLAPRVLRLDPKLPFGYARDLEILANTLTPDRHRGYAVQWFGLAITVLVIALVLTFRRSRR